MKPLFRPTALLSLFLLSTTALADNHRMIRLRALSVAPEESGKPSLIGGKVGLTDSAVPEIDFSWFFTDNFALELIAATTQHRASANHSAIGNVDLGDVNLLPPTLMAQYHHTFGNFKPYVGAGLNYTLFYGVEPGIGNKDAGVQSVHYSNSLGYAWQIGTDYKLSEHVYLNFDIKKLYVSTDVKVKTTAGNVKADVDINPWLVGLGLGYRF